MLLQTDVSFRLTKCADRTAVHQIMSISGLKGTPRRCQKAFHVTNVLQVRQEVEFLFLKKYPKASSLMLIAQAI